MTAQHISESQISRITDQAIDLMVRRANALTPNVTFTHRDIAAAVVEDPSGETSRYLAQLIAWGIGWLVAFREVPALLEVFGSEHAA